MQHDILALPSRRRLAAFCVLYAAIMLYSSTVIGPAGPNFVYRDPTGALVALLATPYVSHGSDQRADWVGNLLMLVPFGFIVAGSMWPVRQALRLPAALGAMLICTFTILTIKYLQLFFPPRTVSLNYIVAQMLGAGIGCGAYAVWHERIGRSASRRDLVGTFVLALRIYTCALCLFVLMPLDFALNADDLSLQFDRLPSTLLTLPGHDRPLAIRVLALITAGVAFVPVGMMLAFVRRGILQVRRGLLPVTGFGLLLTAALYGLSTLIISANPGAAAIKWMARQDADALRRRLGRLAALAALPYLLSVLLVNGLLSIHWWSLSEAVAHAYPLGFLPLFDYYIVSKAAAATNIVGHAVLYMPLGVLLWLRYGEAVAGRAFAVAACLSFGVECARYFRPGLEGDVNAVVIAGLASLIAVRMMPAVWSVVRALGRRPALPPQRRWGKQDVSAADQQSGQTFGEIEDF